MVWCVEVCGVFVDDFGVEDVLNVMESFCEEEELMCVMLKMGGWVWRDDVFRGTMDDDAFERLDK